jgi:hypothetical protein
VSLGIDEATVVTNSIRSVFMERLMPNKTDALSYLNYGVGIDRWARVIVYQREEWGGSKGAISEWMVSFAF